MRTRNKVLIVVGIYIRSASCSRSCSAARARTRSSSPDEFKLDNWIPIHIGPIDMSINKAVLYLFLGCRADDVTWVYIGEPHAAAAEPGPDRRRDPVPADEGQHRRRGTWTGAWRGKWFVFVGTLFLFIWFSNLIGYLPLPTNTEHKVDVFGLELPSVRAVRRHREHLRDAGADARGVVRVPLRGHPGEGIHRLSEELGDPPASRGPRRCRSSRSR